MLSVALSTPLIALALGAGMASAQGMATFPATPHASKTFAFTNLPYKVDTDTNLIRGPQHGYNICNSTTENQDSLCQTAHFNSIDDFCIWAPPEYGREVGDIEGIMVAWCTKPGHGTRLFPDGAITGLQWIKTPSYLQVVGYFDQTKVNVLEGDWGGEMDPHGADLRGNPMGGIVYSDAWTGSPEQVFEWHLFMGGDRFCFKACDPRDANDDKYCEHIYDRIGCDYNLPNRAQDNVFEECEGDNMPQFPGTYVENGQTITYSQPHTGAIGTLTWTAEVPASSSCVPHQSSALFPNLPQVAPTGAPGASASASGSGRGSSAVPSGSRLVPSGGRPSSSGSAPNSSQTGDEPGSAKGVAVSAVALFGAVVAVIVLV